VENLGPARKLLGIGCVCGGRGVQGQLGLALWRSGGLGEAWERTLTATGARLSQKQGETETERPEERDAQRKWERPSIIHSLIDTYRLCPCPFRVHDILWG
jgi:hypothetical protein